MSNFHLTYKKPVTFVLAILLFACVYVFSKMQTSLFPDITFPKVKVIVDASLQPADQMMLTVTQPLENAIRQVPGLKILRSTTSRGSCEISASFDWNYDIDLAKTQLESRINQVRNDLPTGSQISVEKMSPSILPVMGYSLESSKRSLIELKHLARFTVKPFLSQVDGVSSIAVLGGKEKEYHVLLDPIKMAGFGISPDSLHSIFAATGFIESNGFVTDYRRMYLNLTDASMRSISDLENLVVKNDGKRLVRIKDFAQVSIEQAKEYVTINANGNEGVLVNVLKQPDANLIITSDLVTKRVEELKKILPSDVRIVPYYIQANFVKDSISSVRDALWVGLVLAILIAFAFLRSMKAGATLLAIVPVTLGFTIVVLYALGYTFNIMTLGALVASIGLIIDDAVVIVEQIHRTHEEHPKELPHHLVGKSIRYLFPAMVASSLSTIVIFLPFGLMGGLAGAYFNVMTNTMIVTLTCSFLVTWIGVPVVYLLLGQNENVVGQKVGDNGHGVKKQNWVGFFIHRPAVAIGFVILLIASIVLIYPHLKTGFLPDMDEGSIVLDFDSPPGSSLAETDAMLRQVDKIVRATPEVSAFSRRTGAQMGFFITEPSRGDYLIELKKDRKRSTEQVIDDIRQRVEVMVPGLIVDFGQVISDMIGDLSTSVQPIEIKLFGDDVMKLRAYSEQVADLVEKVNGTADVFNGVVISGPSVVVQPNYGNLALHSISPASLQYQLQTAGDGNVVGSIFSGEYLTPVRTLYSSAGLSSIDKLKSLQVIDANLNLVPLSSVANIEVKPGEAEIERENLQNAGIVTARLNGRDLGSTMADIQKAIDSKLTLPQGYHVEYGGDYKLQQQSFKELLTILITAGLLVFAVALFLFREFLLALLLIFISALGVAGGFLALFVSGTPLNVGSYIGLIMIVGIIGENAIFTLWQYKKALEEEGDVGEAIIYSISTRLRPKLMTAFCAIFAMLPLVLGIGPGTQLNQPLGVAIIGGFLAALPLLLIVLPSLLYLVVKKH